MRNIASFENKLIEIVLNSNIEIHKYYSVLINYNNS